MDAILAGLNASRQATWFPAAQVIGAWALVVLPLLIWLAISREDLRADVRAALRQAGITDKAAQIDMGISKSVYSRKLSGEKPLTLEALEALPVDFWQWFAVALAQRHGVPLTVLAGARLARVARRQARMSLPNEKAGVA